LAGLDATFASHAALTLAHILPALTFVVLAPFLYFRRFAGVAWPKRLLFPLGAVVGVTAYAMSNYSIGAGGTLCGSTFQQSLPVLAISCMVPASRTSTESAMVNARNCNPSRHRDYPPGDGHFLRHQSTDASCAEAVLLGLAFWIGFTINYRSCRNSGFTRKEGDLKSKDGHVERALVTLQAPRHHIVVVHALRFG